MNKESDMKRLTVILVMVALVCTTAFAADIQLGVMQNLVNTSFLVDVESDKFGFESAVGLPIVTGMVGGIKALIDKASEEPGEPTEPTEPTQSSGPSGFNIIAGAMANTYWKAFESNKVSLRLGLQVDALGLVGTDGSRVFVSYGPSVGFNYRFNEDFGMNFTSTIPASLLLSPFGDEVSKYGAYYYNDVDTEGWDALGEVFLALLGVMGGVGDQLARLSFKWTV